MKIKYKEQKPELGQLVLVYRDTESKEYIYTLLNGIRKKRGMLIGIT
jgi:hypothetical protein